MVDTGIFQEVGGQLVEQIFSGIIWFGVGIIILAVLLGVIYFFFIYKRKFDIVVKIISERAGDRNRIIFDRAAILIDRKTKTKFFRIWGLKVDLPIPKFNILQVSNHGDFLEIYRTAEDSFFYLTPAKVDKTNIIRADGKSYAIHTQEHKQIDTDINYWNIKRKDMNKKMFDTESILMKILPYIGVLLGGVIMIFILYILLDHLPGILSELRELTKELRSLKGADIKTGLTWPLLM